MFIEICNLQKIESKYLFVVFIFVIIFLTTLTSNVIADGDCNTNQCNCANGCVNNGGVCIKDTTCYVPPPAHPCQTQSICNAGPSPCTETSCIPPVPTTAYICYGGSGLSDDGSCLLLSNNINVPTSVREPLSGERFYIKVNRVFTSCGRGTRYFLSLSNVSNGVNLYSTVNWVDNHYSQSIRDITNWNTSYVYRVSGNSANINSCNDGNKYDPNFPSGYGYFVINSAPTLLSITPNAGYTGTAIDTDNGLPAICSSDNNPLTYTLTFRDSNGAGSINTLGLWVSNSAPLQAGNSVHALVSKGTWISIDADGACFYGCPDMQVSAFGNILGNVSVADIRSRYYFYSPTPVAAKDISIKFLNDYSEPGVGDRNLWLGSMALGVSKEIGAEYIINSTLYSNGTHFMPSNLTQVIGSSNFKSYGLGGQDWLTVPNGVEINGNYQYCTGITSSRGDRQFPNCSETFAHTAVTSIRQLNATDIAIDVKAEFIKDIGYNLNQYGLVLDSVSHDKSSNTYWKLYGTRILDLLGPTGTNTAFYTIDQNTVSTDWNLTDASPLLHTYGMLALNNSDYTISSKIVKDNNTGALISLPGDFSVNSGYVGNTWDLSGTSLVSTYSSGLYRAGRKETFSISELNNGSLNLRVYGVDKACNLGFGSGPNSLEVVEPWFTTKGGYVYSGQNIINPVRELSNNDPLPRIDNPWTLPYQILSNETNVSTNLVLVGGAIHSAINRSGSLYNPSIITNYISDKIYKSSENSYKYLKENVTKSNNYRLQKVDISGNSISGNISSYCNDASKDSCAIFSNQTLNVSNLVCDKKTLILSDEDIFISPEINANNIKNGCIFLSLRDIIISEGDYKSSSSSSSQSESIYGFLISGNKVIIDDVDVNKPLSDILKINGGVVAFGEGGTGTSVQWNRSLRLKENQSYPTFAIYFDPRYLSISTEFFDYSDIYVKDTGFKPY